jgi:hypothetical protein
LLADQRKEIALSCHEWLNDDFDIADLILEGVACGSIIALSDSIFHLLLDVTLLVVLFHFSCNQFEVYDFILTRVTIV